MDQSPGSAERRANLIREMSRHSDRGYNRPSNLSSNASADGDNNTYETKSPQSVPIRLNQEYQLNSSAIRRAFPDFSQDGSSEEDSIEIGRGARKGSKLAFDNNLPSEDVTEDMPFTVGNGDRYRITGTPPIKPRSTNIRNTSTAKSMRAGKGRPSHDSEDKENDAPSAYNLEEKHATVESDETNPRIAHPESGAQQQHPRSKRLSGQKGNENMPQNGTNTSVLSGVNGTHQSFVLPDMPNITELISGVRQDGTPLFTRSTKTRSRFITPSQGRRSGGARHAHIPVAEVPAETDDRALYVALQLLQEKVTALESEKLVTEKKLDDYELEVLQLKSKLEEMEQKRNSDSGIGTDLDEGQLKTAIDEKTRLELSIKTLQDRLDRANRKASKSDITIQDLRKDRDAAQQQVAVAYVNSDELKRESQSLREEIVNIKGQITKLNRSREKKLEKLAEQETELRGKIERREKAINELSSLVKQLWKTRKELATESQYQMTTNQDQNQSSEHLLGKKVRKPIRETQSKRSLSTYDAAAADLQPRMVSKNTATDRDTRRDLSEPLTNIGEDEVSDGESTTHIRFTGAVSNANELSKNSTYMSFMEGDEVAKLRLIVNEDKGKLSKLQSRSQPDSAVAEAATQTLPRKSSLKKVSYNNEPPKVVKDDNTINSATATTHSVGTSRHQARQPSASQDTQIRHRSLQLEQSDLTSAFILPDITLNAQQLGKQAANQKISISRPVPVSERQASLNKSEEDVTIRPAQPPAVALASVLHSLEDELSQLRAQVSQQEALYNQHDPSLSKRKRKIVYARIQKLLLAMELRSDQIYALYDVLEGQKASGQTMMEEEVEFTLQNIGIDDDVLRRHGFNSNRRDTEIPQTDGNMDEDVSISNVGDEYSEELPFEGFDPTQNQTLDSMRRLRG